MITRIFLAHPRSVDESYLQHARFAGLFALTLFAAAFAAAACCLPPQLGFAEQPRPPRLRRNWRMKTPHCRRK